MGLFLFEAGRISCHSIQVSGTLFRGKEINFAKKIKSLSLQSAKKGV